MSIAEFSIVKYAYYNRTRRVEVLAADCVDGLLQFFFQLSSAEVERPSRGRGLAFAS
jgi:hypothetical protein